MHGNSTSPTRTYVAICNNSNYDGYYLRKFILPEGYENTSTMAAWYFLNRLDFLSCIEGVMSYENYASIKEVNQKPPEA